MRPPPKHSFGALGAALAGLLLWAPALGAQPANPNAAARAAFERGLADLDAHRYAAAVQALEESYRINPAPVALYNLALAHRELGHALVAIDLFDRYLREGGDRLPAERAQAVRTTLAELRAGLATVVFSVVPAGYRVTVDGRAQPVEDNALRLDPGDHVVEVGADGHRTARREMRLAPGTQTPVALVLTPDEVAAPAVTPPVAPPAPVVTPHPAEPPRPVQAAVTPVYARWWFWTAIGVVVAGGATALVVGLSDTQAPVGGVRFTAETLRIE